jgi:hypothetical protein
VFQYLWNCTVFLFPLHFSCGIVPCFCFHYTFLVELYRVSVSITLFLWNCNVFLFPLHFSCGIVPCFCFHYTFLVELYRVSVSITLFLWHCIVFLFPLHFSRLHFKAYTLCGRPGESCLRPSVQRPCTNPPPKFEPAACSCCHYDSVYGLMTNWMHLRGERYVCERLV